MEGLFQNLIRVDFTCRRHNNLSQAGQRLALPGAASTGSRVGEAGVVIVVHGYKHVAKKPAHDHNILSTG